MRIIKFRMWDKVAKKMITVDSLVWGITGELLSFNSGNFSELMQFTGLLDKNGNEIYEGDILQDYYDAVDKIPTRPTDFPRGKRSKPFAVEIRNFGDNLMLKEVRGINDREGMFRGFYVSLPSHCEIIGNIYENKELLK